MRGSLVPVAILLALTFVLSGALVLVAPPAVSSHAPGASAALSSAPGARFGPASSIAVSSNPDAVLVDPTNHSAFVATQYGNNVSIVSLATGLVTSTVEVGFQPYPQALLLDPYNWTIYVANAGSNNVSIIGIGSGSVLYSVNVGSSPDALALNPANRDVYVANGGSGTVSIISPATKIPTVIATVTVGPNPDGIAVDTATHDVFVADGGSGNVSVISEKSNTVIRSIFVGTEPGTYGSIAYDPLSKDVYVANAGSGNVTVIGGKNLTAFGSVTVGSGPSALLVDAKANLLFVANRFSNNVSVIVASNHTVAAAVPVGVQPAAEGGLALDAKTGLVYVPNSGTNNVSVISASTRKVVATLDVGAEPTSVGVDSVGHTAFVANGGSSNVTSVLLTQATFTLSGLPVGANVSLVVATTTVAFHVASAKTPVVATLFLIARGGVSFSVLGTPSGYGLSKVTGPGTPSQSTLNLTGAPSKFRLVFGPIELVTFSELGLPAHALWGVAVRSSLAHGGPAPASNSTNTSTLSLLLVKGGWRYTLTPVPKGYAAGTNSGGLHVGARPVTKTLHFGQPLATVLFEEAGRPTGAFWQVNLTGPVNVTGSSFGAIIKLSLPPGNYTYVFYNFTTSHPHPGTGTLVVVAPHPKYVVSITYSNP